MLYLFLIIEQIRVHARARAHARIRGRQKYGPSFVQRYVQTIGALKPKAENKFSFNWLEQTTGRAVGMVNK